MKLGDLFHVQPSTGSVTPRSTKPPSRPSLSRVPGVTIADGLRVFSGSKVIAIEKPLFCNHCDKDLIREYERLCQSAPVADLVALLKKRRSGIVRRTWPDGGRDWCCHACGRAVTSGGKKT